MHPVVRIVQKPREDRHRILINVRRVRGIFSDAQIKLSLLFFSEPVSALRIGRI